MSETIFTQIVSESECQEGRLTERSSFCLGDFNLDVVHKRQNILTKKEHSIPVCNAVVFYIKEILYCLWEQSPRFLVGTLSHTLERGDTPGDTPPVCTPLSSPRTAPHFTLFQQEADASASRG